MNTAHKLEHVVLITPTSAEIIDLQQARASQEKPRHTKLNGNDYEDFLAHYGNGVSSDFA